MLSFIYRKGEYHVFGIWYGIANCVISIEYYSYLLNHVSKNLEVLARRNYNFNLGFPVFIIIGIWSPCQDFPFFDTWFSNYKLYWSDITQTASVRFVPIRNAENIEFLLSMGLFRGSLTKVSSILAYLFVINSLFNPARWKRQTGYTLPCENVKKESGFRIESQGCMNIYFCSTSPMMKLTSMNQTV